MSCDLENPCNPDQVCDLEEGECRDWDVPEHKNLLQIKVGNRYFEGKKFLVNFHLTRYLANELNVPCTLGPHGMNASGEFLSAFGEDSIGIIDLENGETLCLTREEYDQAYNELVKRGHIFLEGKEPNRGTRQKVFVIPYWHKFVSFSDINTFDNSNRHLLAIAPTANMVEVGGERHRLYHGVPVGQLREEEIREPSYPPTFIPEFQEIVREFRGPQLVELKLDDEPSGNITLNANGTRVAVVLQNDVMQVWDIRRQEIVWRTEIEDIEGEIAFSPVDNNILAKVSFEDVTKIWDIETKQSQKVDVSVSATNTAFGSLSFSFDGNFLYYLASEHSIAIYDLFRAEVKSFIGTDESVMLGIAVSPNDRLLVAIDEDLHLIFFDLTFESQERDDNIIEIVDIPGLHGDIDDFMFNPTGDLLVLTGSREPVRLYRVEEKKREDVLVERVANEEEIIRLPSPYDTRQIDTKAGCFNADGTRVVAIFSTMLQQNDDVEMYLQIVIFDNIQRFLETLNGLDEMREGFDEFQGYLDENVRPEVMALIDDIHGDEGLGDMYNDFIEEHYENRVLIRPNPENDEFMRTRGSEVERMIIETQRDEDDEGWSHFICVWDTESRELIQTIPVSFTNDLVCDPVDPHWVVTSHADHTIRVWQID